jgi:hypothetical protein
MVSRAVDMTGGGVGGSGGSPEEEYVMADCDINAVAAFVACTAPAPKLNLAPARFVTLISDHLYITRTQYIFQYSIYSAVQNLSSVCNFERDAFVSQPIGYVSAYKLHL